MKRIVLYTSIFIGLLLASCNSNDKKIKSAVVEYAKAYMVDSGSNLDVLDIIKVDTITPQGKCIIASEVYSFRQDFNVEMINRQIEYAQERIGRDNEMLSILSMASLRKEYSTDVAEQLRVIDSLKSEIEKIAKLKRQYLDSCKTLDNSSFLDYNVKGFIQTSIHNKITKSDTFNVIVTSDYKIIDEQTYTKETLF